MNSILHSLMIGLTFIWAGLALGGNMIAAPAKFRVTHLSTADLLQIGRAQFKWLGYGEWILAIALCLLILIAARSAFWMFLPALLIFALQYFWLQPQLQARSNLILAGSDPTGAPVHLIFILFELLKIIALLFAGFRIMGRLP